MHDLAIEYAFLEIMIFHMVKLPQILSYGFTKTILTKEYARNREYRLFGYNGSYERVWIGMKLLVTAHTGAGIKKKQIKMLWRFKSIQGR